MKKIKSGLKKTLLSYRALPEKKQYVEFFTALLTVPVLLTVIILNLNNLKGVNKPKDDAGGDRTIYVTVPPSNNDKEEQEPTNQACKKEVGPISISYPNENEVVTDNPVIINIDYDDSEYCSVVWSYRINGGRFSEYGSNNIALYNPPQGVIRLELRVKSVISSDEEIVRRNFVYEGESDGSKEPSASTSGN